MRKQIIGFCVSVALVIVALLLPVKATSVVGVGDGKDEAFTSLEDLSYFFNSLQEDELTLAETQKKSDSLKMYHSFQLCEETKINTKSESSNSTVLGGFRSSQNSFSRADLTRTLKISKTENAYYYESIGRYISSSGNSNKLRYGDSATKDMHNESSSKMSLDFHVFIYIEDETVMLRIERLEYTYNHKYTDYENSKNNIEETEADKGKEFVVLGRYLNQWIDCSAQPDIVYAFLGLNQENMNCLYATGAILQSEVEAETSYFKKDGGLYSLKDKHLRDFFGVPEESKEAKKDDFEGYYEVDLKNRVSPDIRMQMYFNAEYSESKNGSRATSNGNSFLNDNISIRNVNNTVIKKAPISKLNIVDLIDEIEAEEE